MENKFVEVSAEELVNIVGGQTMKMLEGGGRPVPWWIKAITDSLGRCTYNNDIPCQ